MMNNIILSVCLGTNWKLEITGLYSPTMIRLQSPKVAGLKIRKWPKWGQNVNQLYQTKHFHIYLFILYMFLVTWFYIVKLSCGSFYLLYTALSFNLSFICPVFV